METELPVRPPMRAPTDRFPRSPRFLRLLVALTALALVAAACGDDVDGVDAGDVREARAERDGADGEAEATTIGGTDPGDPGFGSGGPDAPDAAADAELEAAIEVEADLGRCPDPLIIQTDWFPEPEHGALYELTDGNGRIDPETGRFRGPLAATDGHVIEIRAGGPFLEDQTAFDVLTDDEDVFLAYVNTDDAIANYARHPTTGVVAPLDINPQIIMWDPATYDIESWADVGDTGATINHFPGARYVEYLVAVDLIDEEQLQPRYDGSSTRFVAQGGELIQQGFATQEPYAYENVLVDWGRPVESLLVHDAGYEIYQGALTILDERLDAGARDCLAAFVPLVQQSIVDFQRDPTTTNELLRDIVDDLDTFWKLTDDGVLATVVEMGSLEIVGNGPNRTVGDFDFGRLDGVIALMSEQVGSVNVPPGLRAEDLVTNQFIDPGIGL